MSNTPLYGIHDPGGEHLLPKGSTIVFTEAIGCNPDDLSGCDYRRWEQQGYRVIVRLNNGYGATGTIPTPDKYGDFARRCANYVRNSPGCSHWIIGNEPNHSQERPNGQPISALEYAGCFKHVAQEVYGRVGAQHRLIAAAVAPWNVETGDWLLYMQTMLGNLQGYVDGIALHTYTHGVDPSLISSEATMGAPFDKRRFHFRAYRDLMAAIPDAMRYLPVYVTETDQDVPWADVNSGWVQAAYAEIDAWNRTPGNQTIHCLCLYRWPHYDQWGFAEKQGVQEDLHAATAKGYVLPESLVSPVALPAAKPEVEVNERERTLALDWDPRLTQRGVSLTPARGLPGWRLVRAEYRDVAQSQGRHHIYVDVLSEYGVRVVGAPLQVSWQDGATTITTEAKPGEEAAANFPMNAAGSAYTVTVGSNSDAVVGMGLGDIATPNLGDHVSYYLVFQRVVEETPAQPETPITVHVPIVSVPVPETPAPVPNPSTNDEPVAVGVLDSLVMEAILDIESGGSGLSEGRVVIRFEPAIFKGYLGNNNLFDKHFRYGNPVWTGREFDLGGGWRSMEVGGQGVQWEAFELAKSLNAEAAAKSISMGVGQIMGFNHASIGYASALDMLAAFGKSQNAQLIATVNFILARPSLVKAVEEKDWRTLAAGYNGPGQVDRYAKLLSDRYAVLKKRA